MSAGPNHFEIRQHRLDTHDEAVIDAVRPIVDSHHHLYDRLGLRYLLDDYLGDIRTGHNVRASVFVQARAMLPKGVSPEWQPVGEVEFVNGVAAMSASGIYGPTRLCAGIVGFADLTLGDGVRPILERLAQAGGGMSAEGGRFCGIRQTLCWDQDKPLLNPAYPTMPDMANSKAFRRGFAHLARLGMSFEIWAFFHQLKGLAQLAGAFPDVPIVVNHCGGIVRIRDYAAGDVFNIWRQGIGELARCPNVYLKLSGLGMRIGGFGLDEAKFASGSEHLADLWGPWVRHGLESFGANRCMYGSNFPVDKGSYAFKVGLNALKRLASSASEDEKDDLFWRTAQRFYRLPDRVLTGS